MSTDAFDQAFKPQEPITSVMERILTCLDLDIFSEPGMGGHGTKYTVRLWGDGAPVIEVTRHDLETALRIADENAQVYVNQC